MPLRLREVKYGSEWKDLIQCESESESYQVLFKGVYIPFRLHRSNISQGREGFEKLRDRQLRLRKQDPYKSMV